eukprot:4954160-Prorocentrum_lima.AAC.1
MTSSLVGSEMCIRDRPCATPGRLRGRWKQCGSEGGAHRPRQAPPTRRSAVSYTHLTLPTICSV